MEASCHPLNNSPLCGVLLVLRALCFEEDFLYQPPVLIIRCARAVHCGVVLLRRLCKSYELYVMGGGVSRKEANREEQIGHCGEDKVAGHANCLNNGFRAEQLLTRLSQAINK
jgi:hypothetical protein